MRTLSHWALSLFIPDNIMTDAEVANIYIFEKYKKWVTGTRHRWTRAENMDLWDPLECYYTSNPSEKGYIVAHVSTSKPTIHADKEIIPSSVFQHPQTATSITTIDEVKQMCYGKGEPGQQVRGRYHYHPHTPRLGTKPHKASDSPSMRAPDLKMKILAKLNTWHPCGRLPWLRGKVPSKSLP